MVASKEKRRRTELGRQLAKLRIDFDQVAADMARKIGISSSQLHNIEHGTGIVHFDLVEKINKEYGFDLTPTIKRGGAMARVVFELDDLDENDKAIIMDVWCRMSGSVAGVTLPAENVAKIKESPDKKESGPRVVDINKPARKHSKPHIDDDIGFLDENELEDALDGIE